MIGVLRYWVLGIGYWVLGIGVLGYWGAGVLGEKVCDQAPTGVGEPYRRFEDKALIGWSLPRRWGCKTEPGVSTP
jgi:hypothetical protein